MVRFVTTLLLATSLVAQSDPTNLISWTYTETTTYPGCTSTLGLPRLYRDDVVTCFTVPTLCPPAWRTIVSSGVLQWENLEPSRDFLVAASFGPPPILLLPCAYSFDAVLACGMADSVGYGATILIVPGTLPYSVLPQGVTLIGHLQVVTFDAVGAIASSNLLTITASNP